MKTIVVVGGGFGGLTAALKMERLLKPQDNARIIVIDSRADHVYTPRLYALAAGALHRTNGLEEMKRTVAVPFREILEKRRVRFTQFMEDTVTHCDAEKKIITTQKHGQVPFDLLLLAPGSQIADYGIKGVKEFALGLKSVEDALRIREALEKVLMTCVSGETRCFSVAICGAGPTGVEVASEFALHCQDLVKKGVLKPQDFKITLVDGGPGPLNKISNTAMRAAEKQLRALGVELLMRHRVQEVTANRLIMVTDSTPEHHVVLPVDVVVWSAGVKPAQAAGLARTVTPRGQMSTDMACCISEAQGIFGIGDSAAYGGETGTPIPWLAQTAIFAARRTATNMVRKLRGQPPQKLSFPKEWAYAVTVGGDWTLARVGPWHVFGVLAYAMRRSVDLKYFLSILPFRDAWSRWKRV